MDHVEEIYWHKYWQAKPLCFLDIIGKLGHHCFHKIHSTSQGRYRNISHSWCFPGFYVWPIIEEKLWQSFEDKNHLVFDDIWELSLRCQDNKIRRNKCTSNAGGWKKNASEKSGRCPAVLAILMAKKNL